jgi:DNA polymerase sigma
VPDGQQHHRRPLYNTGRAQQQHQRVYAPPENLEAQVGMLDKLSVMIRADAEIDNSILLEKERFRRSLEELCRDVVYRYEAEQHGLVDFPAQTVELKCFGSLASGFATKASDMDLALVSPFSPIQPDAPGSPIPRLVERAFLEVGVGARLLTRTRVPIIKVCQNPPEKLRADLIAERIKWEKGITETEGHQDDDEPQDDLSNDDQGHTEAVTPAHDHHENQDTSETLHDDKTYAERLEFLRQGKKSLQNYIGQTYKLLRKLGGRDVTPINHGNFTPEEYTILDDVIQAFINGLADEQLKTRLRGYLSLSEYELRKPSKHRTLSSVFTQVEGEIMAMSFATQPVPERDETMQRESQAAYVAWLDIQNQPAFGEDPLQYHKELHAAFLRLQSIPSLQLGVLQQHQYESTFDYYNRTNSIMLRLGGHDEPEPTNGILPLVVRRYVAGIRNKDIREVMEEFLATSGAQSLRAVGRRHKSLQLASDFEKAMTKGIFSDTEEAAVKYYIDWLRRPMVKVSRGPGEWFDFIVPMDTYLAQAVMPVLLRLPDPGELTENKPRDPYHDKLEFPKDGAGVQCDINFSAHLALHNTALLRCYSLTDARVRPLILFVKHWAKVRDINTPYRGTLNSYGYVLMMLHYLVNVAQPFVCPNLQQLAPPPDPRFKGEDGINTQSFCNGANVRFWKDEKEIGGLAAQNVLNGNSDSLGQLLRGFFEYYAQSGFMSMVKGRGFHYGRDVISLRTPGGILTKEQKGWTNAKTVTEVKVIAAPLGSAPPPADPALQSQAATIPASGPIADTPTTSEVKEVRHRYLLAIEDPFELDHNVARTVTHNGIVAIRDEFRRAWRIIQAAGKDEPLEDLLLDAATAEEQRSKGRFVQLLDEIHGQNKGHRLTG